MPNQPLSDEPQFPARPGSRAERLVNARLEAARLETARVPQPASPKAEKSKPVRARELNKRIRAALREHTDAVYGETPMAETSVAEISPVETAPPKASSSWEDLANEIAPTGMARRGLATGARRGASIANPDSPKAHPVWRPAPVAPSVIECRQPKPSELLHDALGGEEKVCDIHGAHYIVSRAAGDYDSIFAGVRERLEKILAREVFPTLSGARVEDLLFVDIETAGLSSAMPLFLVGALGFERGAQVDLFLARDYPEERALLAAFLELARGKTLVTFNGKSFDWPYIEGRARGHRLSVSAPRAHLDMLHHARRTWKHSLPNCKLQTLELYLCGRTRIDDVPGSQIPRAYHEFVATHAEDGTGAHLMAPILHHNALDILTLSELVCIAGEEL